MSFTIPGDLREARRAKNHYRKHLTDLTAQVRLYLACIDALMKRPESVERGQSIAGLTNALELANDMAVRFGLGVTKKSRKAAP